MKLLKVVMLWIAAVGTILILGDDLLGLFKVIEFRGAIHDRREFLLVIGLFVLVGVSALLLLVPLLLFVGNSARARLVGSRSWVAAAVCAATVLLLNGAHLEEWAARALEGRNYSAAWCLLASVICLITMRRSRE